MGLASRISSIQPRSPSTAWEVGGTAAASAAAYFARGDIEPMIAGPVRAWALSSARCSEAPPYGPCLAKGSGSSSSWF